MLCRPGDRFRRSPADDKAGWLQVAAAAEAAVRGLAAGHGDGG
jgi:hypothetical protein